MIVMYSTFCDNRWRCSFTLNKLNYKFEENTKDDAEGSALFFLYVNNYNVNNTVFVTSYSHKP